MVRKSRLDNSSSNHERWLLTYADLITLLLAFFIVMYSMSRIDAKKFGEVAKALQGVLRGSTGIIPERSIANLGQQLGGGPMKIGDLRLMQTKLKQAIAEVGLEKEITPIIDERGLVVHVTESALFDAARADLKPTARPALDLVARALAGLANSVRIEGHTDSRPISTARFPSNWELSTARAATVVRYFIEQHKWLPYRISALGYGEYRPLVRNDSPANMAKNRRVDIVVLAPNLSLSEPEALPFSFADSLPLMLPVSPSRIAP